MSIRSDLRGLFFSVSSRTRMVSRRFSRTLASFELLVGKERELRGKANGRFEDASRDCVMLRDSPRVAEILH